MVRHFIFLIAVFGSLICKAQLSERVPGKGLLRAQANIAAGKLLAYNQGSIYVAGDLAYYLDTHTSLRGDGFYFINAMHVGADRKLLVNHGWFTGVLFHLPTGGNLDPFVGFQPGMAITQLIDTYSVNETEDSTALSRVTGSPLVSMLAGLHYYAPKFFHFFATVRYVNGTHLGNTGKYYLDELRFSFGLGFHLSTIRKQKAPY